MEVLKAVCICEIIKNINHRNNQVPNIITSSSSSKQTITSQIKWQSRTNTTQNTRQQTSHTLIEKVKSGVKDEKLGKKRQNCDREFHILGATTGLGCPLSLSTSESKMHKRPHQCSSADWLISGSTLGLPVLSANQVLPKSPYPWQGPPSWDNP